MTKNEVDLIIAELVENYPNFDSSDASIDRHYKYLQDFPFEAAMQNVVEHIKTNKFPPLIADIRGRLGDLQDSQRSKEEAEAYFAQVELWKKNSNPPPAGYWENMKARLRGDSA